MNDHCCPLCDQTNSTVLFSKQDIPYFRCSACSFVFSKPEQNANIANHPDDYGKAYLSYLEGTSPHRQKELELTYEWLGEFTELTDKSLLDIGCGGGHWVNYLRKNGTQSYGVEPSKVLFDLFLSKHEHFSTKDPFSFASDLNKKFDVITSFDVLEHTADPALFMQQISKICSKDGLVFLSFPDGGSWLARFMKKHWHYYNKYHLSYFDQHTVERLAKKHSFTIIHSSHRSRYQSLGYMLSYAAEFMLGKDSPAGTRALDSITFPINFFDILFVVLKPEGPND